MGDIKVIKRVHLPPEHLAILEKLAETSQISLSQYLDKLVSEAIIRKERESKEKTPLYIWKS